MNPAAAASIVLAILALGEVISILTRARVPGMLVAFLALFAFLQLGVLPDDVVEASQFTVVGSLLAPALLVHMGTMIPLRVIRQQYKAVIVAVCGVLGAGILITAIVGPVFGYTSAVAGVGPISGGLVAYLVTTDALKQAGLSALVAVPLLVFILQQLGGLPLTTNLLRRYATRVRDTVPQGDTRDGGGSGTDVDGPGTGRATTEQAAPASTEEGAVATVEKVDTPRRVSLLPGRFEQSNTILLFLVFAGGAIAVGMEELTGLSYSVWALALGIAGAWLGIYPVKALEKANGFTIALVGLLLVVLSGVSTISVDDIITSLPVILTILLTGTIGLMLGGYIGARICRWAPAKGVPVALTALLGFPLDYIVTQEVSRSIGRTERERQAILDDLLAPMLIGGFATVTTGSVLIASILIETL